MPKLFIIAGCNGAGKSIFANSFLEEGLISYDYDKKYLINYNSLPDSELRDKFTKDITTKNFEQSIEEAIKGAESFCYETNFDHFPLHWAKIFKKNHYEINLIFFCLENLNLAKERVAIRTASKGHFVNDSTIEYKWKKGYANLNTHYTFFDNLLFVDNSKFNSTPKILFQIKNKEIEYITNEIPKYFKIRLPRIFKLLNTK